MARGRTGSAVSLFAFQDIITSVSGILIVIVLLMALELVDRPQTEAPVPAGDGAALARALEAAEAERDELRHRLANEAEAIETAAGTSKNELDRQIADYEAAINRLERENDTLETRDAAIREAAAALEVKTFDAAGVLDEIEELTRRAEELQREIDSLRKDDRVVFTLPRSFNKPGWIVVLDGETIEAAPIGKAARPTRFRGGRAAQELVDWSRTHSGDYFLLLIRPGGIDNFDVVDEAFRDESVSYGFDLIGAETSVLHPEQGAAP